MRSIYAGREDDTWWVHGLLHEDDDLFDKEQNNKSE
jgi:predicted hydrolase (HD superfamily)